MKKLLPFLAILIVGAGCTTTSSSTAVQTQEPSPAIESSKVYISFIQNVHDWVFPENSLETLNRLIDLHERYEIPVEMYLDDQVVQSYLELQPEIFERLKSSPYVTVSFHIRPPHPVYDGFDTIGLADMSGEEQYETLYLYETHRLDLATGGYTNEPGGYAYLKELIGYAPRVVAQTTSREFGSTLSRVYEEMGALFAVVHGRETTLEDTLHGLHARPEDVEVKLYEDSYARGFSAQERFEEWTEDFNGTSDYFINLKYHEENFYTQGSAFGLVFWESVGRGKDNPKSPPYDLTAGDDTEFRTEAEQAEEWQIYEETLQYVAEHRDVLTAITSVDLEQMLDK